MQGYENLVKIITADEFLADNKKEEGDDNEVQTI